MKIHSLSNKPLNEITMRLYSVDTKFSHHFVPFYPGYGGMVDFNRDASAFIEFQDSREIDLMIDMLQRFKQANRDYFGAWDY